MTQAFLVCYSLMTQEETGILTEPTGIQEWELILLGRN